MFTLEGFRVVRMTLDRAGDVQSLYERCNDYHLLHEGTPTRLAAGEEELTAVPTGRSADDKFPFGIYAANDQLIGYLDLFRDYPAPGEWWVGLLLLDPEFRGRGLGGRIFSAAMPSVADHGARAIQLAVLEHDAAALRFWRRQGFVEIGRRPYQSQSAGKAHTVVVFRYALADRHAR